MTSDPARKRSVVGPAAKASQPPSSDEASTFVVRQSGERTIIAFRDWGSARHRLYHLEEAFVAHIKSECAEICNENRCNILTIDVTDVDVVPSSFLSVLVLLSTSELQVELLNPSERFLELLETTGLSRFFVVRDAESSPVRKATGWAGLGALFTRCRRRMNEHD